MLSICGDSCCEGCSKKEECGGCIKTEGHPFGGVCVAAECVKRGGAEAFFAEKQAVIEQINSLGIKDLRVNDLNLLNGFFVNLEYELPNGSHIKLLNDNNVYWGNQLESSEPGMCYGIVAGDGYLLVCKYGCNGASPEIIVYKKL